MKIINRKNKLYILGSGPGTTLSISLESLMCLKKSGVVILDGDSERGLKPLLAGKQILRKNDDYNEMQKLVLKHLKLGENVCFISSGNPFLFIEEGPLLSGACSDAGFQFEAPYAQSSLDQLFCMLKTGFDESTGFYVATFQSVVSGIPLNTAAPVFLMCVDQAILNMANAKKLKRSLLAFYVPSHKIEALNNSGFRAVFSLSDFLGSIKKIPPQSSLFLPARGTKRG